MFFIMVGCFLGEIIMPKYVFVWSSTLSAPSTPQMAHQNYIFILSITMAHLSVPDWLETELQSVDPLLVICEQLELKNWLTHGLLHEITVGFLLLVILR
jgi:hypothetical protein